MQYQPHCRCQHGVRAEHTYAWNGAHARRILYTKLPVGHTEVSIPVPTVDNSNPVQNSLEIEGQGGISRPLQREDSSAHSRNTMLAVRGGSGELSPALVLHLQLNRSFDLHHLSGD